MSSVNLFISSQLCSENAADPTHAPYSPQNPTGICAPADHIGGVVAFFAGFLPFCFSGLRVSPVVMSSVNLLISSQLRSKNAAYPKRTPRTLRKILQEYALRRVFYQKKRAFSCNSLVATASEKLPRIYFQEASLPKAVSGQRTKVAVCLTSTMHSAPMGTSVPAVTPRTPPNRRLRQLQRTARTHRKCERSSHTCAGCLRRRSDCSWRRRSPAYSAAAVKKMMIRTRHRRIVLTQLYKSPCKLCKDAFWGGCCFPPHLNQTSERQSFMLRPRR